MKSVGRTGPAKTVCLGVILLASVTAAAVLSNETVAERQWPPQKDQNSALSSMDLYQNMMKFEQEQGNTGNDDENKDDDKDSGGSLLRMMTAAAASDDQLLLKCVSCTGLLPSWYNKHDDVHADEQSYCLPDVGGSTVEGQENAEKYPSVCTGAVRCWKVRSRTTDGLVRVSRGCVNGDRHSSNIADMLHPCRGTVPVDDNSSVSTQNKTPPHTVWTNSFSSSSAESGPRRPLASSYAVECCDGVDFCNDGAFPPLPGDGSSADGSPMATTAWWRQRPSSVCVVALLLLLLVAAVAVVYVRHGDPKNRRKRRRSKSGARRKRKKRRRRAAAASSDDSSCGESSDGSGSKPRRRRFSDSSLPSVCSSSSCQSDGRPRGRGRRPRATNALNMVDLLKDVVVVPRDAAAGDGDGPTYAVPYSPAVTAVTTDSTTVDEFSPPPYEQDEQHGEKDWTSGSGYGMPVLVQRTLAKQIQLRQLVGKGRYGEVWRATYWNGGHEHVAVKIFLSKDEPSWKRETEIYSTVLMRHDNILGFIGSDIMTSRNSYTTQLLLITHYHQHGSLYDFLQTNLTPDTMFNAYDSTVVARPPLTIMQMLNILYTVSAGLCHLHTEIHGTQGKPGIAHRDVKSKNVLIKCSRTGICCVADFGMAVTSRDATLPAQTTATAGAVNQNTRVGTKRYMAPEVLDDTIASTAALASNSTPTDLGSGPAADTSSSAYWCFDAYRRGDVYSYALVMWEVLSRTLIFSNNNDSNEQQSQQQQHIVDNGYNPYVYRAPYQDRGASWDPGFDDMRQIVCSADPVLSRPGIAAEWVANPVVNPVVGSMRECWSSNPNARLPMLRVKKTLSKLLNQVAEMEQDK